MGGVVADMGRALLGLSAVIMAASAWLLVWRKGFQRVNATLKNMSVTLEGVDRQVNRVTPGAPSIPATLASLHAQLVAQGDQLDTIERRMATFLTADQVTDEFTSEFNRLHERLDMLAGVARRQHPDEFSEEES